MSFPGLSEDAFDSDFLYIGVLGLWCGSIVGGMAQVVPYQIMILLTMALAMLAWVPGTPSMMAILVTAGVGAAGIFGTMVEQIPWGVGVTIFLIGMAMIWKQFGGHNQIRSVPPLIVIPLFVIVVTGLFYNFTYPDFCPNSSCNNIATWNHGVPTTYIGCVLTCSFSAFSVFGSSVLLPVFSFLGIASGPVATGDIVGLFINLFSSAQSTITIITIFIGTFLFVIIGLGIGINVVADIFASGAGGGITINDAGTRLAQSLGIGLILFGALFGAFGGFLTAFGSITTFSGAIGVGITLALGMASLYGFYLQAKQVT